MVAVLFVCMGNICRSPSAEGVFLKLIETHNLDSHIEVDSAGTHGYHVGEQADRRSIAAARKRGVDLTPHRARQVDPNDFEYYDFILAMDQMNYDRLISWCPDNYRHKIRLFLEFAAHLGEREVPDPYYGGPHGFDHVLDLVEEASHGLLEHIRQHHLKVGTA